jgi:hypothetical protein
MRAAMLDSNSVQAQQLNNQRTVIRNESSNIETSNNSNTMGNNNSILHFYHSSQKRKSPESKSSQPQNGQGLNTISSDSDRFKLK